MYLKHLTLILPILLFIASPFYQKLTGKTTHKKAKRVLIILSFISFAIYLILVGFPHIKSSLDTKGYVIQFPVSLIFRAPFYRKTEGESVVSRLPFEPPALPEREATCDADYCSAFEEENWEGWEEFRESTKYPGALIPSLEGGVFDTARLWFKKFQPSPEFKAEFTVRPYNPEMGNIVISYGTTWRCIVAEANYNTITCEAEKPLQRLSSQHLTSKEKRPIKPETDIVITVETILTSEEKIKIIMNIDYIDIDSNKSEVDFDFSVGAPTPKPSGAIEYVGVGIIDPQRKDPAIEFKNFKFWKK